MARVPALWKDKSMVIPLQIELPLVSICGYQTQQKLLDIDILLGNY